MKIVLKEDPAVPPDELHLHCREKTGRITALASRLAAEEHTVQGKDEAGGLCRVPLSEIDYFETVEKTVFAYTEKKVLQTGYRLYECEDFCPKEQFFRISKTTLVNLARLRTLRPEAGRRLKLQLQSGEWLMVSRLYAAALKKQLEEGTKR